MWNKEDSDAHTNLFNITMMLTSISVIGIWAPLNVCKCWVCVGTIPCVVIVLTVFSNQHCYHLAMENCIFTWTGGDETLQDVVVNSNKGSGEGPKTNQGSRSSSGWSLCSNVRPHSEGANNPDRLILYRKSNKLESEIA